MVNKKKLLNIGDSIIADEEIARLVKTASKRLAAYRDAIKYLSQIQAEESVRLWIRIEDKFPIFKTHHGETNILEDGRVQLIVLEKRKGPPFGVWEE